MASEGHQVSRNAKWAIAQTIISAAVLFFLYRFLLKELGAEKLGLWSLILASTSLARLGELGFSSATLRFVGKYIGAGAPQAAADILETAMLSISLPFIALAAAAIPLIGFLLPWFVPAHHMLDALAVVPWAMFSLWLGVTSGLAQSALDGCGRMDQKNKVLIGTNLLYFLLAISLAPKYGLKGVAIAQAIQAGVSLVAIWWLTKTNIIELPWIPRRWHKESFFEIFSFAFSMQISSISGTMIEPITKALISRFGGLEFLAYYEMANQVVLKARGVLMGGFQALLPVYAATNPDDFGALWQLHQRTHIRVASLGIPYLTMLAGSFPIISIMWIGTGESTLINCGVLISLTWLIATTGIPSHFFAVGTGRGWIVARNQILMLALTGFAGSILGYWGGGYAVVLGALLAFFVSTEYLKYSVANVFKEVSNKNVAHGGALKALAIRYAPSVAVIAALYIAYINFSIYIYIVAYSVAFITLGGIAYGIDAKLFKRE